MKSRRELLHQEIVEGVRKELNGIINVRTEDIKRQIEHLLDEYIKRDPNNSNK